ncbi:MAG: efflux RND transporter periplasmic adaptor subunit [Pseudomonadota bacterium]|nr:efflux RND transporter periplasmic adaptor subunit [Pseudomonadota bacterium]
MVGSLFASVRGGIVGACISVFFMLSNPAAFAQDQGLSERGKAADKNNNGVIDRDEAGGPLKANFDDMDCNKSGTLDGGEIRGFFSGEECPKNVGVKSKVAEPLKATSQGGKSRSVGVRARGVRVDAVIIEPFSQTSPVIGRLVAQKTGDVSARINGAVADMPALVGARVKKGDVIARLARARLEAERDKVSATIATRRALVKFARAEYSKKTQELRRITNLKKSSAFSRARYEDLQRDVEARQASLAERQSQLKEAQAQLNQVIIDLHNTEIRAPYNGVVSEKHTEVGAYVSVGTRVVSLINDTEIEVEAEVPSRNIAGLISGFPVRFSLDDGTQHRAIVRSVVPRENVRTRTRPVRFIPDFGPIRKPFAVNQSVTVLVPVGKVRQVITVHKDAVIYRGKDRVVSIIRRGKAFPRKVKLGPAVGNRFVVEKGLKSGDKVVTHGNETLPPGTAVKILTSVSPSANAERGITR